MSKELLQIASKNLDTLVEQSEWAKKRVDNYFNPTTTGMKWMVTNADGSTSTAAVGHGCFGALPTYILSDGRSTYLSILFNYSYHTRYFIGYKENGEADYKRTDFPVTKEMFDDYARFIFRRSVFSPTVKKYRLMSKDYVGAIYDMSYPSKLIMCGMMALRFVQEQPKLINYWSTFKQLTNEKIAFTLLHYVREEGGLYTFSKNPQPWHTFWYTEMTARAVKNFLNETPVLDGLPPMAYSPKWRGLQSIFEPMAWDGEKSEKWGHDNPPKEEMLKWPEQTDIVEIVNGFGKKTKVQTGVKKENLPSYINKWAELNGVAA